MPWCGLSRPVRILHPGTSQLRGRSTAAANAYDVARAGGIHSGTITTYASKPASELRRAAESYDVVVAEHIRKLNDPGAYAEKWATGSDLYRQGLLRKWENDLVRNAELAEIMRNLLREASP